MNETSNRTGCKSKLVTQIDPLTHYFSEAKRENFFSFNLYFNNWKNFDSVVNFKTQINRQYVIFSASLKNEDKIEIQVSLKLSFFSAPFHLPMVLKFFGPFLHSI